MSSKYMILFLVLSGLAASLGIAGCGSDESAEASLTKTQLAKRADLICANASEEQFKRAGAYLQKHPGAKERDMIEPAGIPPLEKAIQELKTLSPPAALEAEFDAFTEEFEKALKTTKEDLLTVLSPQKNPFNKANKLARELELGDCSRSP